MRPTFIIVPSFVLACLACGGASGPAAFSAAAAVDDLEQAAASPERDQAMHAAERAYAAALAGDAGLMDTSKFATRVEDAVSDGSISEEEAEELTQLAATWPELDSEGRATLEAEMVKRRKRRPQIDDLASWDEAEIRRRIEAQGLGIESCSRDEVDPPHTEAIHCNVKGSAWGTLTWEGFESAAKRREIDAGMADAGLIVRGHQTHHVVVMVTETAQAREVLEGWASKGEPTMESAWLERAATGWTIDDCLPSVPGVAMLSCNIKRGADRGIVNVIERGPGMAKGFVEGSFPMIVTEKHSISLTLFDADHLNAFVDALVKP